MPAYRRRNRFRPYRTRRSRRFSTRRTIRTRQGRRRLLWRQRRNAIPEVKFMNLELPLTNIPIQRASFTPGEGVNPTLKVLPEALPIGTTGTNDRIGKQIKTRKARLHLRFTAMSNIVSGNLRPDANIKYWIWSCRRDISACITMSHDLLATSILSPYSFTCVKEGFIRVGNTGLGHLDGSTDSVFPNVNRYSSDVYWKVVVPHIRTINFGPVGSPNPDFIDEEDDQLYITFCNQSDFVVRTSGQAFVTYIDP